MQIQSGNARNWNFYLVNDQMDWFMQICQGGLWILLSHAEWIVISFNMYGETIFLGGEFYIWFCPQFTTQKPLHNRGSSFIAIDVQHCGWVVVTIGCIQMNFGDCITSKRPHVQGNYNVISHLQENFPWEIDSSTLRTTYIHQTSIQ